MYQTGGQAFKLDRQRTIDAVAQTWGLTPGQPESWRLDRFGEGLGRSLENLTGVIFAPGRRLIEGPDVEVRVYALADDHHFPLIVCVTKGSGPMSCTGIEDFTQTFGNPWGASPALVVDALERLLDVAHTAYVGSEKGPAESPREQAPAVAYPA